MAGGRFMQRITRWMARRLHGLAARFERLGGAGGTAPMPAPRDPELLALAERYPGAPEHWLRLIAAHVGPAGAAAQALPPVSQSPRRPARNEMHWPQSLSPTPPVRAAQSAGGNASRAAHRPRLAVPAQSSSPRRGELPAFSGPAGALAGHGQPGAAPGPIGRIAQRLFSRPGPAGRTDSWWARETRQDRPSAVAEPQGMAPLPLPTHTPVWLGENSPAPPSFDSFDPQPHAAAPAATGPWLELPAAPQPSQHALDPAITPRGSPPFTPIGREPEVMRFDTFSGSPRHPWPVLPPSELGAADAEPTPPDDVRFRHEQMVSQWNA
jgi:hypothetical protein